MSDDTVSANHGTPHAAMPASLEASLDRLDLLILNEMEIDGRQPVSELAKRLGISRANASKKLQKLIDRKITRIVAFTSPQALGYHTVAIVAIQVVPSDIDSVADRLAEFPNVHLVVIAAGQHDILIWTMFQNPADLSTFLGHDLGGVTGITSTETMVVLETRKMAFSYMAQSHLGGPARTQMAEAVPASPVPIEEYSNLDHLDLLILRELEDDGRRPVSELAKKLGTSRANVSHRLQRLLDHHVTRIVAFTNPLYLGYHIFAMIGIKVLPNRIDDAVNSLAALPEVYWVVRTAGRFDVLIWTMFHTPGALSSFLRKQLAQVQGITTTETIMGLDLRKMGFSHLATSHLEGNGAG